MSLSHSIEHYFKPKMPTISLPRILGYFPTSPVLGHIPISQISLGLSSMLGHFPTSVLSQIRFDFWLNSAFPKPISNLFL